MASSKYQIIFRKRFERVFAKLDKTTQQKIVSEIEKLEFNPFDHSQIKKITGTNNGYRLRAGRWRILFSFDNKTIDVIDLFMEKSKEDYKIRMRFLG